MAAMQIDAGFRGVAATRGERNARRARRAGRRGAARGRAAQRRPGLLPEALG